MRRSDNSEIIALSSTTLDPCVATAMSTATLSQDDSAVIRIPARFDFRLAHDFNSASEKVLRGKDSEIVVDLGGASYIDSAGMGMLLVLRDRARAESKTVILKGIGGAVKDILGIANFQKIFAFR